MGASSGPRRVSFAAEQTEPEEIQPAPPRHARAATATSSAPSRRRKRRRCPPTLAADFAANAGASGGDAGDSSSDSDGMLMVADADSLVHDADVGVAVTAYNIEDELQDGAVDPETKAFVPSELRAAAARSPPRDAASSSDEDARVSELRVRDACGADDSEPDDWIALEESVSRPAPMYGDGGGGRATEEPPPAKKARGSSVMSAESPSAERTQAELITSLAAVLEDGECAGGAIRRLKRSGDVLQLDAVTELADGLMALGVLSAYELTRADVLSRVVWSLTWGATGGLGAVHGPFPAEKMHAWAASGFFSHENKTGWVRADSACPWVLAALLFRRERRKG